MKTDEVIALEIATLAELAKLAPELSSCGLQDNSRNVINAQIDVIAYRLTTDQVHDAYLGKCPDDSWSSLTVKRCPPKAACAVARPSAATTGTATGACSERYFSPL